MGLRKDPLSAAILLIQSTLLAFLAGLALIGWIASFTGCGFNDKVVKVTEIKKNPVQGLKSGDIAKFEEYKKVILEAERGDSLSSLIEQTPSYTVPEYLAKFPEMRRLGEEDYRVGGYDVLNITVYEEKDLSRESVRVSAEGNITFPLIGRIRVAEMTASEIETLIARKLAEGQYLLEAHVSVMVAKYESRKFAVHGAVKQPGNYSLQARERILDGISRAGGIETTDPGEKRDGVLIRTLNFGKPGESKAVINFDLNGLLKGTDPMANLFLMEQDVIYVPRAEFFYIMGQIQKPGSYNFTKRDTTIVEAISMAGGFTKIAAGGRTRIVRIENNTEKIYEIDVDAITKAGKMTQAVIVKPNDLIIVPESFF